MNSRSESDLERAERQWKEAHRVRKTEVRKRELADMAVKVATLRWEETLEDLEEARSA